MKDFLCTHTLALTPLSPIHIGCGEDFEPTNYLIEDGLLYGFDPSRARLNDLQRSKLMDVARRGSLAGIQQFFRDNAAAFKPHAYVVMPVAKGVAKQYKESIGKAVNIEASGKAVFNKLEIERHVFTGPQQQPFIPGTSFKGALRTSWLDELNDGKKPIRNSKGKIESPFQMEERLLGGDFQTSPLRLLKVADLMPVREPAREVLFAVNHKKNEIWIKNKLVLGRGPTARKDCIRMGQYRLFQAEVTLPELGIHKNGIQHLNSNGAIDFESLISATHKYHVDLLTTELDDLSEKRPDLVDSQWVKSIRNLLVTLKHAIDNKKVFLVRLGRYGGAKSKTLSGDDVASIKIMQGKGQKPTFESTTKTVWLAAQDENESKHLLPFGWAIVEIDPKEDSPTLKMWCEYAIKNEFPDLAKLAAQKAALEAERQAQATKEAALAAMSPSQREMAEWREKWEKRCNAGVKEKLNQGLHQEATQLVNKALTSPDWSASDRAALAQMLETCLPQIVQPWDAKEQRKKLKFNALRGVG